MAGKLYIVATPIGNLGDFSERGRQTLAAVDFIASEDTRRGAALLNHFGIKKPQISYFEHNRRQKGEWIAARIEAGESCALITDAGTPAVSDPGADLVQLCAARGIEVVSVPGPCALVAALSVSGMDSGRFTFEGFLSVNKKNRGEHLRSLRQETRTMVFYEAPHKLVRTLTDLLDAFGDRQIALCREMTKIHEEVVRTTLTDALALCAGRPPRGEYVLIVAGAEAVSEPPDDGVPLEEVGGLMRGGMPLASAARQVAEARGVSKNALYRAALAAFATEE